ncbi:MAG TPA: choice-of-anchor B family protein [Euzebyales bacterium]
MARSVRGRILAAVGVALLLAATMTGAGAHAGPDDDPEVLGHSSGEEVKRISGAGRGMPSIRGPFPDTEGLEFLGQLTNAELGVERLIFTGASWLSDIWGWTSPDTGDEYALVGTSSGVAFVRVTDPADPEFLGLLPTTEPDTIRNFWWDIKTYQDHAYITTEVRGAGVAIVDLTQLDGRTRVEPGTDAAVITPVGRYDDAGYVSAHNISINTDTGYAYLTGVAKDAAVDPDFIAESLVVLDLTNPAQPVEVAQIGGIDSHDAQVVSYAGPDADHQGAEIAVVFNGGDLEVGIYDVSDKSAIEELSTTTYPGASFTHQGWLTEDHSYLLVGDEEDELFGISDPQNEDLPDTARTYIFDVRDLDAPEFIGFYDSPAASIDHNLFVDGTNVWQANYTAGVRVLDASDVADGVLTEIAHMDTEPRLPNRSMSQNINIFAGPWGVYPFFESDTVIASDGLNGLILMRLE